MGQPGASRRPVQLHLRLEYRWEERTWAPPEKQPRKNGLHYHTHGFPGDVFRTWRPSAELEIMQGSTGMIVMIGTKTRAHTDASLAAGHYSCPVGGQYACVVKSTGGPPACSLNQCADLASNPIVEEPPVDDPTPSPGGIDADGNCLGQIEIFSGRGMRCRPPGLSTPIAARTRARSPRTAWARRSARSAPRLRSPSAC